MSRFKLKLFCLAFVFLLAGCASSGETQQTTVSAKIADPVSLYTQAAEQLHNADQLSYYIQTTRTMIIEGQEFTQTSQQRLTVQNPGKETMRTSMTETLQIGSASVNVTEIFENGTGYVTVDGKAFSAPLSAEEVSKRYAPAVFFDPSIYEQISFHPQDGHQRIAFSSPTAAEGWALPANAAFTDASGYADLDENGTLKESLYTLSYTVGDVAVTQSTKVTMLTDVPVLTINAPDTYTAIEHFDAPKMLELACGYLLQAENIQSIAKTNINCQTFSISRAQSTDMTMTGSGANFSAEMNVQIDQTNQSRGGETTQLQQTEIFKNNVYSIAVNNAEAKNNASIDASAMKTYCQDMLIQDILLPEHIISASAEETETALTLTYQASNAFAEAICANICELLYSDAELLHTLSSSYETQSLQCVLTLDKNTGLPVSFLSDYSASHTIEQIPYLLESKTEQTYKYEKTSG